MNILQMKYNLYFAKKKMSYVFLFFQRKFACGKLSLFAWFFFPFNIEFDMRMCVNRSKFNYIAKNA